MSASIYLGTKFAKINYLSTVLCILDIALANGALTFRAMPPPRAASPRDVQRQRDEDTVRAHVRRSLVGLTPADTRATPENLERLAALVWRHFA